MIQTQVIVDHQENRLHKKRRKTRIVVPRAPHQRQRRYQFGKLTETPPGSRQTIEADTRWGRAPITHRSQTRLEDTTTRATTGPRRTRPNGTTNIPTETTRVATITGKITTHTTTTNRIDGTRTTTRRRGDGPTATEGATGRPAPAPARPAPPPTTSTSTSPLTGTKPRPLPSPLQTPAPITRARSSLWTISCYCCTVDAKLDDCKVILKIHITREFMQSIFVEI